MVIASAKFSFVSLSKRFILLIALTLSNWYKDDNELPVIAKETYGASESLPAFLDVIGISEMGKFNGFTIENSQCVYVPTGGMIPEGADSMVMI